MSLLDKTAAEINQALRWRYEVRQLALDRALQKYSSQSLQPLSDILADAKQIEEWLDRD